MFLLHRLQLIVTTTASPIVSISQNGIRIEANFEVSIPTGPNDPDFSLTFVSLKITA